MKRFKFPLFLFLSVSALVMLPSTGCSQSLQGDKLKDSLIQALSHPKDDTSKIKTFFSLANFFAINDSATAAGYANEGRKLSEKYSWQKGLGLYYLTMARVYYNMSDNISCMLNARKAYDILIKTGETRHTAAATTILLSVQEHYIAVYHRRALTLLPVSRHCSTIFPAVTIRPVATRPYITMFQGVTTRLMEVRHFLQTQPTARIPA